MKKTSIILLLIFCFSCAENKPEGLEVIIKNTLDIDRAFETVEVDISDIALNGTSLEVVNSETNEVLMSQIADKVILFQPEIPANSEATFKINLVDKKGIDSTLIRCYSRFVPERTDDYAWENNRVAFRTFGPMAQKMKEDGIKGGTLTSGMDAWLKRVEYPIINKWYQKHTSEKGSYHEDTGEGLDNYHVGVSRGVGGVAVKTDSIYAFSKNFINYKTLTNGLIRTSFILEYADWSANGKKIRERKLITLDYGQNLSRHIVQLKGADKVSIGLTLHKNDGEVTTNTAEGWMSYWEPFDDSELGQGIVITDPRTLIDFDKYVTDKKDQSNLYVQLNVSGVTDYYAGFGWKKSGHFDNKEEWNNYLSRFSKCLDSPLEVNVTTPSK